jgi:hypothetical protein
MVEQVNHSLSFRRAAGTAVPTGIVLIVMTALAVLSGCAANFSTLIANHPECADDAGIARWKVEQCLGYGNVQRDAFDMCLTRQQVPQRKIEMLDNCAAL